MSEIQFREDQEFSRPALHPKRSAFVQFVLKIGLADTENKANYLLLGFVVVGIIFTIFTFISSGKTSPSAEQPFKQGQNVLRPSNTH